MLTLPDRRSRLRSATEDAHRHLDAVVDQAGFFRDRLSYVVYLRATLRARRPLELALHQCDAAKLFALSSDRDIAPALRADIEDVTGAVPATDFIVAGQPLSAAQALGTLYVLEGSALGARHLAPRAHSIGMSPTFGARHFARQTATPKSWSVFLRVLEAQPLDAVHEGACIEAATAAFACFARAYRDGSVD
jgi:heme oxygenase